MTLSWIFPFNIWLQQRARIRKLQEENAILRAHNAKLLRETLESSLQLTSLTNMYMSSMLAMQHDYSKQLTMLHSSSVAQDNAVVTCGRVEARRHRACNAISENISGK